MMTNHDDHCIKIYSVVIILFTQTFQFNILKLDASQLTLGQLIPSTGEIPKDIVYQYFSVTNQSDNNVQI